MKYVYNLTQFNAAVKFIAKKNKYFTDDIPKVTHILENLIRSAVKDDKHNLAEGLSTLTSTAGFMVHIYSLSDDTQFVEILVDPSVGKKYKEESVFIEGM